ncbi:MAG TPA: pilus assembly protein [Aggregatilineales bacterium]|nr:pilus assembly protein [Anaerolineales bacterium]HRE47746.1 pilus assembly protein [Aggregatilineales bacterium]
MRRLWRRFVEMLDGQPTLQTRSAPREKRRRGVRGQSLIELALTTPILFAMIVSLAEIGFVANNYLIIMDLVRESGRRGATLNPTLWDGAAETRNYNRLDCDQDNIRFDILPGAQNRQVARGKTILDAYGYTTRTPDKDFGYFDWTICQALLTMEPLEFEDMTNWGAGGTTEPTRNATHFSKNDVVVSAIAYSKMDYTSIGGFTPSGGSRGSSVPTNNLWITVTGRWPLENRYCFTAGLGGDVRDPFDYKRADFYTAWTDGPPADEHEINGTAGTPLALLTASQGIRGFVFTGNVLNDDGCRGSRFTVQAIEERLNREFSRDLLTGKVRNGGLVLVEFHWQHHPVIFGPIFQGFTGTAVNDPMLYIYGIFPAIGAEPTATPQ